MSEENIKENYTDTVADAAASSAEERLSGVQLHVHGKSPSHEKAMAEIKAENGKRFDGIRARMAENLREAENKGRARIAEIESLRKEAQAAEQDSEPVTQKDSPTDDVKDSAAFAESVSRNEANENGTNDEKDESELVINLGGSPLDYGDKCIIRVGAPTVSSYFFQIPCPQPCAQQTADKKSGSAAAPRKAGTSDKVAEQLYAPIPQPAACEEQQIFYEDRHFEYAEPLAEYPDPLPETFSEDVDVAAGPRRSLEYEAEAIEAENEYRLMYEEGATHALANDKIDLFEVAELNKAISAFYREESSCARKIQKIEAKQKDADTEQNIVLTVEKIGLQKELCELAVETLGACVYVSARGKIARHEKLLRKHIDRYNLFCEEYEKYTGRPLHRLDYGMIEDVLLGRISRPIPNVYYYGAEGEAVYNSSDAEADRIHRTENEYAALSREYERYLEDGGAVDPTPAERRAFEKRNAARISAIRRATERDILLVALRNEYRLESLEARRDILVNSYGSDKGRVIKELRSIERTMSKVRAASRRSIPIEREDNTRFYLLSALEPQNEKVKDGARRDRLMSLRQRLELLLSERESINERLIVLYGGSDKKLKKAKVNRKAAAVRRKSARRSFKKQGDLARRIERFNVPSDMKEKAYSLLNQKTAAVAKADEIRYKIKHLNPHGRARGELYSEFKRAKKEIKRTDSEIRYMLRRLKKIQDRNSDRRELAILFVLIAVFAATVGIVWFAFGEEIVAYFKELFAKLKGL